MSSGAGLYRDALQEIVERIPLHKDILRFAAVCRRWRSIVMENLHRLPQKLPLCYCLPRQHPLPLLMQCNDEEAQGKIEFLSVLNNRSLSNISVPEISGNWIAGSFNGWLVLVEILGEEKIKLLNPLTRAQMLLPSLSTFKPPRGTFEDDLDDFAFVRKALVISEPEARNLDSCIVVAIVSCLGVLSFCRPGDDKWTNVEGSPKFVHDVISYKGQLYATVDGGALLSFGVEQQTVVLVAGHTRGYGRGRGYLIESPTSGDLLLVARIEDEEAHVTLDFSVYKLEEVDETQAEVVAPSYTCLGYFGRVSQSVKYQWVQLDSLDDQILFVGQNYSKSVPASLHPDLDGNCIYFTDDDPCCRHVGVTRRKAGVEFLIDPKEEKYDMGIFDMEEETVQPIPLVDDKLFRVPPVWVELNPW